MHSIPQKANRGQNKPLAANWFSSPTIRYRIVNHGNMALAIEAGLDAIDWPTGCQGGREFIHVLLALLNGRNSGRLIASHQTIAALMNKRHLPETAQRVFVSRQIAGFNRIAQRVNRAPIGIESGQCKGNATRYDLRPLLKFAIAVLGKYDEKKRDAAPKFNPTAAIFSLISPALIYIPVFSAVSSPSLQPNPSGCEIQRSGAEPEQEPPFPPHIRVTHLGYQYRQQSPAFAKELEGHDFERWVAAKMRIVLERAKQGGKLLPLHYLIAPPSDQHPFGVCSCREGKRCGKRAAKHPMSKLVRRGANDATGDPATIRDWIIHEPCMNVGLVTDQELVVDIDFRRGGQYSWRSLQANYGPALTYREKAANGRHHHFDKPDFPVTKSNDLLGSGIDVITGAGNYVVIFPSFTNNAYYVEDPRPRARVPLWLLDLLLRDTDFEERDPSVKVKQGKRNYWLWRQGVELLQRDSYNATQLESKLWDLYLAECEAGNDPMSKAEIRRIRIGCFQRVSKLRRERVA